MWIRGTFPSEKQKYLVIVNSSYFKPSSRNGFYTFLCDDDSVCGFFRSELKILQAQQHIWNGIKDGVTYIDITQYED